MENIHTRVLDSLHENLKVVAKNAILSLFSDTSVDKQTTLASLESLRDELDIMIEGIESDIENE